MHTNILFISDMHKMIHQASSDYFIWHIIRRATPPLWHIIQRATPLEESSLLLHNIAFLGPIATFQTHCEDAFSTAIIPISIKYVLFNMCTIEMNAHFIMHHNGYFCFFFFLAFAAYFYLIHHLFFLVGVYVLPNAVLTAAAAITNLYLNMFAVGPENNGEKEVVVSIQGIRDAQAQKIKLD
ncbi:hypothetical protein ACJX0J_008267 [Zea mays]